MAAERVLAEDLRKRGFPSGESTSGSKGLLHYCIRLSGETRLGAVVKALLRNDFYCIADLQEAEGHARGLHMHRAASLHNTGWTSCWDSPA